MCMYWRITHRWLKIIDCIAKSKIFEISAPDDMIFDYWHTCFMPERVNVVLEIWYTCTCVCIGKYCLYDCRTMMPSMILEICALKYVGFDYLYTCSRLAVQITKCVTHKHWKLVYIVDVHVLVSRHLVTDAYKCDFRNQRHKLHRIQLSAHLDRVCKCECSAIKLKTMYMYMYWQIPP